MLKRLIEVALPLQEVSEQSAHEKTVRSGHISNLHLWWARRPLAACRAAVFASLLPDPDDPECPKTFRKLVMEVLRKNEFTPKNGDGSTVEDTPRNRCLEFIKHLVKWENSNDSEYIDPARKLIAAAHKFLNAGAVEDAPKVLDPFSGGGAIPLEALRLGCEAQALDLNPVAHLIELCTLVYPQKYGQPDSRPVPDYIKRLISQNRGKKKGKGQHGLFDEGEAVAAGDDEIIPDVEISEAEYRKHPLAADVKYWGYWVQAAALRQLGMFYPSTIKGGYPIAYLWVRTVKCPNPSCAVKLPLYRQSWVCKKPKRKVALKALLNQKTRQCDFTIVEGRIDFDPDQGTTQRGQASCPFCQTIASSQYLQSEGKANRIGQQMVAVVSVMEKGSGRHFREPTNTDLAAYEKAVVRLERLLHEKGETVVPHEPLKAWSGVFNAPLFGIDTWGKLFNPRQLLAMATFTAHIRDALHLLGRADQEYSKTVGLILAMNLDRLADVSNTLCRYEPVAQCPRQLFGRQAIPMVWDYGEGVPISGRTCSWTNSLDRTLDSFTELWSMKGQAKVVQGSAAKLPYEDSSLDAVVTDPPYYDGTCQQL